MRLFNTEEIEEHWRTLQQNKDIFREILDSEEVRYNLGQTSEDVTFGEFLDRAPDEVRELEDDGLVYKFLESKGDEYVAVYKATSIGEGLLETDTLEEAREWYMELERYADEEYSS